MKTQKAKKLFCYLIIISIICFEVVSLESKTDTSKNDSFSPSSALISIHSDNDFGSYNFSGLGTAEDPYVIEDYSFTYPHYYGIFIEHVTKYVIIRNCSFIKNSVSIHLSFVESSLISIINNSFKDCSLNAIRIRNTKSVIISNNQIIECFSYGIYGREIRYITIDNNYLKDIKQEGIFLLFSGYIVISQNTFINNLQGFSNKCCSTTIIQDNIFFNSGIDVELEEAYYRQILTVINNTVNNKNLGFFVDLKDQVINESDFGLLYIINCFNVSLSNIHISNTSVGIKIFQGSFISLTNCCLYENNKGFVVRYSKNIDVTNCTFNGNAGEAILLTNSVEINIKFNQILKNSYGIHLFLCLDVLVSDNLFFQNTNYAITNCELFIDPLPDINLLVYHNNFTGNMDDNSSQVQDSGRNSFWYDPELKVGNYWSTGIEAFGYAIDGYKNYLDKYPINDDDEDSLPDYWEIRYDLNLKFNDSTSDPDLDGLTNIEEYHYGTYPNTNDTDSDNLSDYDELKVYLTDPRVNDTDYDTILDGWEVQYGLNPLDKSDAQEDFDNDGLANYLEFYYGCNPFSEDSDNDKIPDLWEIKYNLNPIVFDSFLDSDGDMLINFFEFLYSTDPQVVDTDSDGLSDFLEIFEYSTNPLLEDSDYDHLPDGWEVQNGLNPLTKDSFIDFDGDNMTNYEEYLRKTNPLNNDSDFDSIPDNWEVQHYLNPIDSSDAHIDSDNDMLTSLEEYFYGTNPNDPDSDNDGYLDGFEIDKGTDPNDPESYPCDYTVSLNSCIITILVTVLVSVFLIRKMKRKKE